MLRMKKTLICSKFGADLVNTSTVTSRKKVTSFFAAHCNFVRMLTII